MSELTKLSLSLKDPVINKDKDNYLFKELKKLNQWIDTSVRKNAHKINTSETKAKFKGGIVFPYKFGDDKNPFVILACIPELSAIFETKARAPFKIVFEVCRLNELIDEVEAEVEGSEQEIQLDKDTKEEGMGPASNLAQSNIFDGEEEKKEEDDEEGVGMFSTRTLDKDDTHFVDNPFGMDTEDNIEE